MPRNHKKWDLYSIPPAAIPQDLLKIWWSHYTNSKRKKKQVDDPKERERLDKIAASMRKLRANRKAEESSQ